MMDSFVDSAKRSVRDKFEAMRNAMHDEMMMDGLSVFVCGGVWKGDVLDACRLLSNHFRRRLGEGYEFAPQIRRRGDADGGGLEMISWPGKEDLLAPNAKKVIGFGKRGGLTGLWPWVEGGKKMKGNAGELIFSSDCDGTCDPESNLRYDSNHPRLQMNFESSGGAPAWRLCEICLVQECFESLGYETSMALQDDEEEEETSSQ